MSVVIKNRYWVLRHGKSIPNERGLIVSSMENGTRPEFQLASDGVNQAQLAAQLFQKELEANNIHFLMYAFATPPFARTSHTAKVVATVLNLPFEGPQCDQDLRERFFGPSFELLSHDKYEEIWEIDEKDPLVGPEGGESVKDVASRLTRAMAIMESEFE
ncbi:Histidine phosphatase superfamily, clade-1, partial [Sesbania bispinosa]